MILLIVLSLSHFRWVYPRYSVQSFKFKQLFSQAIYSHTDEGIPNSISRTEIESRLPHAVQLMTNIGRSEQKRERRFKAVLTEQWTDTRNSLIFHAADFFLTGYISGIEPAR